MKMTAHLTALHFPPRSGLGLFRALCVDLKHCGEPEVEHGVVDSVRLTSNMATLCPEKEEWVDLLSDYLHHKGWGPFQRTETQAAEARAARARLGLLGPGQSSLLKPFSVLRQFVSPVSLFGPH